MNFAAVQTTEPYWVRTKYGRKLDEIWTKFDTELVNKRKRWLGLPPMQEMKKDEFMITPAYDWKNIQQNWLNSKNYYFCSCYNQFKIITNDLLESISQRGSAEKALKNIRTHDIADELRRCCQLYETQLRDRGKKFRKDDSLIRIMRCGIYYTAMFWKILIMTFILLMLKLKKI